MQLFTELMIIAKTNKVYDFEIMNNKVEIKNNALPINNIFSCYIYQPKFLMVFLK